MEAWLHPTVIMRIFPSWFLWEAESREGAEWEWVNGEHSYSSVDWISCLAEGQTRKLVGSTEATAFQVLLPTGDRKSPNKEGKGTNLTRVKKERKQPQVQYMDRYQKQITTGCGNRMVFSGG